MNQTHWQSTSSPRSAGRRLLARTRAFLKRGIDIFAAGIALLLLMPLFPIVALMIRIDSPGQVLFSQARVGKNGRHFRCWKLRSMYVDAEERKRDLLEQNESEGGVTFKMKQDPRITHVGRFIRKASIDELPQLWNVVIGDMSLVGPRPAIPGEVASYSPYERCRLTVKPGITCLWQISGRSDLHFNQQVQLDVKYARSPSFLKDVWILVKTIPAVLLARGAY